MGWQIGWRSIFTIECRKKKSTCKGTATNRSGKDSGQVQYSYSLQRSSPITCSTPSWRFADLNECHWGRPLDGNALGTVVPFIKRTKRGSAHIAGRRFCFKIDCVPSKKSGGDSRFGWRALKDGEYTFSVTDIHIVGPKMREIDIKKERTVENWCEVSRSRHLFCRHPQGRPKQFLNRVYRLMCTTFHFLRWWKSAFLKQKAKAT
jgi:hypothetical protein